MISLVLTGGIASGKSTLAGHLMDRVEGLQLFDADAAVSELYQEEDVLRKLSDQFGEEIVADGKIDRAALRDLVFSDSGKKAQLEQILHPLVREKLQKSHRKALREGAGLFLADIPLFFETGWKWDNRGVLVTACPEEQQISRLSERGIDEELARKILANQKSWMEKVTAGDTVFWTSGTCEFLIEQVDVYAEKLKSWIASDREKCGPPPPFEIPEHLSLAELRNRDSNELISMANDLGLKTQGADKTKLVFELFCKLGQFGCDLVVEGVVEKTKDSFGMIREPGRSFRPGCDDVYLGAAAMAEYGIGNGNLVRARVRPPRGRDNYLSVEQVLEIEGVSASLVAESTDYDDLTSEFPEERFHLETEDPKDLAVRLVDLVAPLGKGQRGLIVAPPRGGKTVLLKQIARAIQANHPETELIVLLLDERPEEVTDFEETVDAQVYSSTFDETSKRHAQVSDLVLERAKRLVESGKDVVILLDSLTRLARGYNNAASGGPIGSGGVNPSALAKARKFFGAARNVTEGGSLTILATCLVETENRMDDVIFEELKGTGNMEIRLDRDLAERRVYPAIHIPQSGTRNDDRLYHKDEMPRVVELRRQLASMPVGEAVETLMKQLKETKSNAEFLMKGLR